MNNKSISHLWPCHLIFLSLLIILPFLEGFANAVDVTDFTELKTFSGHTSSVYIVVWNPSGCKIASAAGDGTVRIWDVATGINLKTITGSTITYNALAWSPDGNRIAYETENSNIKIMDITNDVDLITLIGHTDRISSIAWSPNGTEIATGSIDKTIKIWNITTGVNLKTLRGHDSPIYSLVWGLDGSKIISGSRDGVIEFWEPMDEAPYYGISVNGSQPLSLALSPDGNKFASGGMNNKNDFYIKIWDTATGANLKSFNAHNRTIGSIAWSPDGSKLVSGSEDGTIKIWDIATGENLKTLLGDTYHLDSVAWSPDGNLIVSSGHDDTIKIWGLSTYSFSSNVYVNSILVDRTNITVEDSLNVTATLTNNGTADGPNTMVRFYDGTILLMTKNMNITCGGTSRTAFLWKTTASTSIGIHNLRVAVGMSEKTVSVKVNGRADVHLKDILLDKTNLTIGDDVNVTVTLANGGTADGPKVDLMIYDGNMLLDTFSLNVPHGSTNSTTYIWKTTEATPLGPHIFRAVLGANEKNITVYVNGRPSVHVTDIWADKTSVTIGTSVIINAVITNNGTADALGIDIFFQDDVGHNMTKKIDIPQGGTENVTFKWDTRLTKPGIHTLTVIVGTSSKDTTVNVKKGPVMVLDRPISSWIIGTVILVVIILVLAVSNHLHKTRKHRSKRRHP
jgi:WD40 repeat protein